MKRNQIQEAESAECEEPEHNSGTSVTFMASHLLLLTSGLFNDTFSTVELYIASNCWKTASGDLGRICNKRIVISTTLECLE
jgi:hypothetical protein